MAIGNYNTVSSNSKRYHAMLLADSCLKLGYDFAWNEKLINLCCQICWIGFLETFYSELSKEAEMDKILISMEVDLRLPTGLTLEF